jgi:hypothetical protein
VLYGNLQCTNQNLVFSFSLPQPPSPLSSCSSLSFVYVVSLLSYNLLVCVLFLFFISLHAVFFFFADGIPTDDVMTLHLDTGRVNATCYDVNNVQAGSRPMFGFHFKNANGHGKIVYDNVKGAVALAITDWELQETRYFVFLCFYWSVDHFDIINLRAQYCTGLPSNFFAGRIYSRCMCDHGFLSVVILRISCFIFFFIPLANF